MFFYIIDFFYNDFIIKSFVKPFSLIQYTKMDSYLSTKTLKEEKKKSEENPGSWGEEMDFESTYTKALGLFNPSMYNPPPLFPSQPPVSFAQVLEEQSNEKENALAAERARRKAEEKMEEKLMLEKEHKERETILRMGDKLKWGRFSDKVKTLTHFGYDTRREEDVRVLLKHLPRDLVYSCVPFSHKDMYAKCVKDHVEMSKTSPKKVQFQSPPVKSRVSGTKNRFAGLE